MTSNKPYLIRAIYDWIVDNKLTPHIVVNVDVEGVQVPAEYVKDGKIILNISPDACVGLHLDNDRILFSASFSSSSMQVFTPPEAVIAIYAKENGRGMVFGEEGDDDDDDGGGSDDGKSPPGPPALKSIVSKQKPAEKPAKGKKHRKPDLKIVK